MIEISCNPKVQVQVSTVDVIRISLPCCTDFCWLCKETWGLVLSVWPVHEAYHRLPHIIFGNSTWLNSASDFVDDTLNIQCASNPTRYSILPFSDS